jgi:glutamyl/glutaminyl-tRNA synthetase
MATKDEKKDTEQKPAKAAAAPAPAPVAAATTKKPAAKAPAAVQANQIVASSADAALFARVVGEFVGSPLKLTVNAGQAIEPYSVIGDATLFGENNIARYLARTKAPAVAGEDALSSALVDQWLEFGLADFEPSKLNTLNDHLANRSFLVNNALTLADIAVFLHLQRSGASPSASHANVKRWTKLVGEQPSFAGALSRVTGAAPAGASAGASSSDPFGDMDDVCPPLEGAVDGQVVTRFPPEPSGYLHIGHCKAALVNNYYARRYHGKLVVRFDDTNPSKEKEEFQESILRDLETLDVHGDVVSLVCGRFCFLVCLCLLFRWLRVGAWCMGGKDDQVRDNCSFHEDHFNGIGRPELPASAPRAQRHACCACSCLIVDLACLDGDLTDFTLFCCSANPAQVTHTSDYFDMIEEKARELIRAGKAYMDNTPMEQMREERTNRINSVRRDSPIEENLQLFDALCRGEPEARAYCLRAKIDMQSENGTLRDPVMYRYNDTPHLRTGTKYKAYPTYDFACPIVDSVEGVTHAMRTTEYNDRDEQYRRFQRAMGLRPVKIHAFARMGYTYTLLSKRKLAWFVDHGKVENWYDPRFPTIQGVVRRGIAIPALKKYILSQGASRRVTNLEWDSFWAINKQYYEPIAPRYMGVFKDTCVPLHITNVPAGVEAVNIPLHPKNAEMGDRVMRRSNVVLLEGADAETIAENEKITLLRWNNVVVKHIQKDNSGRVVRMEGELVDDGDFKKTKKLTWLADVVRVSPPMVLLVLCPLACMHICVCAPAHRSAVGSSFPWTH